MRRLFPALLLLCAAAPLRPALLAGDFSHLEKRLKQTYTGKLVTLYQATQPEGFELQLPKEMAQRINPEAPNFLRIQSLKLKERELQFEARSAHFFQDAKGRIHEALGRGWKCRLRWRDAGLQDSELERAIGLILAPDEPKPEQWKDSWPPQVPVDLDTKRQQRQPSREIMPGVFTLGADITPPKCEYCPTPEYPDEARPAKASGRVICVVLVTETGRIRGIRVEKSAGFGFDEATVATAAGWLFTAAMRDGKPVSVVMPIEATFRIYEPRPAW